MNMIAAIQLVAQHQQLLEQGLDPRLASLVLGVWFDTVYVPTIQQTQRAWRSTRSRFNAHIRPVLGQRVIAEITPSELARLIDGLQPVAKDASHRDRLAPATVNRVIALLKALFANLVERGYLASNPARGLKFRRERNQRGRVLRLEEYQAFFDALAEAPELVRLLILLLLLTGMRVSEALGARWEEVDMTQRVLRLPDTKSGRPRLIPLSDDALLVCGELQARRTNDYLFPGRHAGHLSRPSRAFHAVLRSAGIDGLWLHDLRRTFATLAAQQVPLCDVSRLLGHSSVKVTERYVVTADARLHAAVSIVGQHLQPAITRMVSREEVTMT